MLEKTDTDYAPWHVIASDQKKHARLARPEDIVDEWRAARRFSEQKLDPAIAEAALKLWGWKEKDGSDKK